MINYLKRFVAWATELRDDPFFRARIKLTFQKFLLIIFLFFTAGYIINLAFDYRLRINLSGKLADKQTEIRIIDETGAALRKDAVVMLFILGGCVLVAGYVLAGATLVPIKQIVRAQKRFIADASHELRTPLSIMKTNSEVMLMDGNKISSNGAISVFKSNIEEIDRMSKLIENLLRLSYYDNKSPELPFSHIDFARIVTNIVEKIRTLAFQKSIRLYIAEIETAEIVGNESALEQLVTNIVKNAILYTPNGGTVSVVVKRNVAGAVKFIVKDTGVGMHPDEIPLIFNPFYKTDSSKLQFNSGSGLGMTIVKKIVDRHLASIKVDSILGGGTTVSVIFPSPNKLYFKESSIKSTKFGSNEGLRKFL
jgi:two-component system, OmpR family, sensor histidine kinase CiaH